MTTPPIPQPSFDELATRAAGGDRFAEEALFHGLRVRFVQVAKRRVRADDVEDVTQEALGIVLAKYAARGASGRVLTWGLAILRNVIGNHYQRRERLARGEPFDERRHTDGPGGGAVPAARDGGEGEEILRETLAAIDRLSRDEARCAALFGRILESLAEGGTAAEMTHRALERMRADFGELSRGALYVALHRCRASLRAILADMGVLDDPAAAGRKE